MSTALDRLHKILDEVHSERERQDARWGEQNHPSVIGGISIPIPSAFQARHLCNTRFKKDEGSWADIVLEEFAEAIDAPDDIKRRAELIQLIAVGVAWVECIDRKAGL